MVDYYKYIKYIWDLYINKNKYIKFKNTLIFSISVILLVILICIVVIIYLNNIPVRNIYEDKYKYYFINYDRKLFTFESNEYNYEHLSQPSKFREFNIKILSVQLENKNNVETSVLSSAVNYNKNNKINGIIIYKLDDTEDILSFIIDISNDTLLVDNKLIDTKKLKNNIIETYLLINNIEINDLLINSQEIDDTKKWKNLNLGIYKKIEKRQKNRKLKKTLSKQPNTLNLKNPVRDNYSINTHRNKTPEKKEDNYGIVPIDVKDDSQKETETIVNEINSNNRSVIKIPVEKYNGIGQNITVGNMFNNFLEN